MTLDDNKEMKRNSFVEYIQWAKPINDLPDEDAGKLYKAVFDYWQGIKPREIPPMAQGVFSMMRAAFEKDAGKYREICNKRRQAINSRWEVAHGDDKTKNTKVFKSIQMNTNEYKSIQTIQNVYDNEYDNDIIKKEKTNVFSKEKQSVHPLKMTVEQFIGEVSKIAEIRGYSSIVSGFIDYWTERDAQGKPRYKREKCFEISRRLARWQSRNSGEMQVRGCMQSRPMNGETLRMMQKD